MLQCSALGRLNNVISSSQEHPMTSYPSTAIAAQWTRLWVDTSILMADAAAVMAMRSMRMMSGGRAATDEAERMLGEKVEAGFELVGALASGRVKSPQAAARKTVSVMGKRVRGNRKRLG
jgi:hypothetical protein